MVASLWAVTFETNICVKIFFRLRKQSISVERNYSFLRTKSYIMQLERLSINKHVRTMTIFGHWFSGITLEAALALDGHIKTVNVERKFVFAQLQNTRNNVRITPILRSSGPRYGRGRQMGVSKAYVAQFTCCRAYIPSTTLLRMARE